MKRGFNVGNSTLKFAPRCFFCGKIFGSEEITQYIEDEEGDTAVCPFCKTDSVLGESCGYEITEELLKEMHDYWF